MKQLTLIILIAFIYIGCSNTNNNPIDSNVNTTESIEKVSLPDVDLKEGEFSLSGRISRKIYLDYMKDCKESKLATLDEELLIDLPPGTPYAVTGSFLKFGKHKYEFFISAKPKAGVKQIEVKLGNFFDQIHNCDNRPEAEVLGYTKLSGEFWFSLLVNNSGNFNMNLPLKTSTKFTQNFYVNGNLVEQPVVEVGDLIQVHLKFVDLDLFDDFLPSNSRLKTKLTWNFK